MRGIDQGVHILTTPGSHAYPHLREHRIAIVHHVTHALPDIRGNRVEASSGCHSVQAFESLPDVPLPFTVHPNLIEKPPLVVGPAYIQRPLGMPVCVANHIEMGSDIKSQHEALQIAGQSFTGRSEIDPDCVGLCNCHGSICGPEMTQEQGELLPGQGPDDRWDELLMAAKTKQPERVEPSNYWVPPSMGQTVWSRQPKRCAASRLIVVTRGGDSEVRRRLGDRSEVGFVLAGVADRQALDEGPGSDQVREHDDFGLGYFACRQRTRQSTRHGDPRACG